MTEEEHTARAMLLGMEHVQGCIMINDNFYTLYRKRVGDGRYAGCALFSYFEAETLLPVEGYQDRSELDKPMERKP